MRDKLIELLDNVTLAYRFDAWENTDKIAYHLLANGVIVLPVKVGDTVYKPVRAFSGEMGIWEVRIEHISFSAGTIGRDIPSYAIGSTQDGSAATIYFDTIGKTVFLTREEAEAALKEEHK